MTVPVAGVAGEVLFVGFAVGATVGGVSCSDDAASSYTVDADITNSTNNIRTVLCAAVAVNPRGKPSPSDSPKWRPAT